MKHPERIPDCLTHIVVACNRARTAMSGVVRDAFLQSFIQQDVVIRQIEVIGEATKRITATDLSFAGEHPELALEGAISMRNRIAHQDEGVDLQLLWQVATVTLPTLREAVVPVLLQLRPDADLDSLHF